MGTPNPRGGSAFSALDLGFRAHEDFFQGPRLPHKCGVPVGLGTPPSCGSEEFCRAPPDSRLPPFDWTKRRDLSTVPPDGHERRTPVFEQSSLSLPPDVLAGDRRFYHQKFPTQWMSPDGRTLWLLYSGLDGGLYTFCLKQATLVIGSGTSSARPASRLPPVRPGSAETSPQ